MMIRLTHISEAEVTKLGRAVARAFGRLHVAHLGIAGAWVGCAGLVISCRWRLNVAPQRLWQRTRNDPPGPSVPQWNLEFRVLYCLGDVLLPTVLWVESI
jgi:hypothetical protein